MDKVASATKQDLFETLNIFGIALDLELPANSSFDTLKPI